MLKTKTGIREKIRALSVDARRTRLTRQQRWQDKSPACAASSNGFRQGFSHLSNSLTWIEGWNSNKIVGEFSSFGMWSGLS